MENFILDTDSYKFSHFLGYPQNATAIYSYAESRGGVYPATVFFGLQKFLKELAAVRITKDMIDEAEEFAAAHGVPFNRMGWEIIAKEYRGKIPVVIKAVPEGTLVPTRNVLVTVENTDSRMPWLTSYIETALLRATWYPVTVATRIFYMKKRIKPYFDKTSDTGDMGFAVLDFSARGCSSLETARVGGMAHLISFLGSDNIPAVVEAQKVYGEEMAAYSVAATEHSVMTSYGEENEEASFEELVDRMMPEGGILSVVSDTWDVYRATDRWGELADKIKAKNGTLVVRPDSGDMEEVIPVLLEKLMHSFGYSENSKGYKVLHNVKLLQGDGIDENSVVVPFEIAERMGISADSIMTGSGGGLMQANIDRDTCKFAFKASNVSFADGKEMGIHKQPITDKGKASKKGRLVLVRDENGGLVTMSNHDENVVKWANCADYDLLVEVYRDGKIRKEYTLSEIRERVSSNLN